MRVSGFTIVRNAIKFNYPLAESILSILPICDEFIVNVGDSDDDTLGLIWSIKDPKIKIIENKWDMSKGKDVLSEQTNIALASCSGNWAFYLQSDEVIHEKDLPKIKNCMEKNLKNENVDALRFSWLHFYGSFYRYRIDSGWYQKQDRIIRNNGEIESYGDAYSFRRKDGKPLRQKHTHCLLYHYGWTHPSEVMTKRRVNAEQIGFVRLKNDEREGSFSFGDLKRFPVYFGSHPKVMSKIIREHDLSSKDWREIEKRNWWNLAKILRLRYKTSKRIKEKIT